jgi:hypothetical protein
VVVVVVVAVVVVVVVEIARTERWGLTRGQ